MPLSYNRIYLSFNISNFLSAVLDTCGSAVIFSVMHFNPWQSIPTFFVGLMLGWIYWRTRSLWCCIFIHMVNNTFAFIFSVFLFPDTPVDAIIFDFTGGYYIFAAALLVCVITGIWIKNIVSCNPATDPQNPEV